MTSPIQPSQAQPSPAQHSTLKAAAESRGGRYQSGDAKDSLKCQQLLQQCSSQGQVKSLTKNPYQIPNVISAISYKSFNLWQQ